MMVIAVFLMSFGIFGFCYFLLDRLAGQTAEAKARFQNRVHSLHGGFSLPSVEKISRFSEIAALNRFLKEKQIAAKMNRCFEMAGWNISAGFFILISLFASALLYFILTLRGLAPFESSVLALLIAAGGPFALLAHKRNTYYIQFADHFPKALQMIRASLSAGLGLTTSFERAAQDAPPPVNKEFQKIIEETSLGKNFDDALRLFQQRVPISEVKAFVIAITVQKQSGGNLSELIKNLEETIHARISLKKEMRVLCTQARLSGWIISLLPILLAIAVKIMNPDYYAVLTDTEAGHQLVWFTIAMQIIGFLTIKKVVTFKILT